ncbi:MAG: hypothetical protein ACRD0K_25350 [Egibacteraceae bacterium]
MQLTALIVGALFTGVVAYLFSGASGTWQQAVRAEVVRSTSAQELTRVVYGDEAPVALRVAAAQARAEAIQSSEGVGRLAAAERTIAEQLAFALSRSVLPGSLAADPQYALPGGSVDVARRLADLAREQSGVPDPDRTAAEGDAQAHRAGWISVATVVVTGVAVVAAAAPHRPAGRRRPAPLEIIPQPGVLVPGRRRIASVLLALWAAGVLLPLAQLVLGGEEQRSQAAAARTAVQISGQTAISLARSAFATNALRDAVLAEAASPARQYAALDASAADAPAEFALAQAEASAAATIHRIADEMTRAPTTDSGIDPYTATALASGPDQWRAALGVQHGHAARANRFGAWANGVVALIAVVAALSAVVEARFAASSTRDRRRR